MRREIGGHYVINCIKCWRYNYMTFYMCRKRSRKASILRHWRARMLLVASPIGCNKNKFDTEDTHANNVPDTLTQKKTPNSPTQTRYQNLLWGAHVERAVSTSNTHIPCWACVCGKWRTLFEFALQHACDRGECHNASVYRIHSELFMFMLGMLLLTHRWSPSTQHCYA